MPAPMRKPDELKRVLLAFLKHLRDDPAKLSVFLDRGRIAARPGSLGFEYRYTLNVVVQDYAGPVDDLMVPVLAWIAEAQPDLLQKNDGEPFTFEAEILDGDLADVSIVIELTEAVRVTPKDGGGFTAEHLPDPTLEDEFEGVCCVPLRQLFANGDLAAQSPSLDTPQP